MLDNLNLFAILAAALITVASPGPTTLAIAATSMNLGRRHGLALASGVMVGSLFWSISAALGLGALMRANAWIFEIFRYLGAGYLLYLAWKSARSALRPGTATIQNVDAGSLGRIFLRGLALHITNPKAILFFGALYAVGIPADAPIATLGLVILLVGVQSLVVFHGYALLFSNAAITRGYMRMKRWWEGLFAIAFGLAGLKVLTSKL